MEWQATALVCRECGGLSDGPVEAPGVCACKGLPEPTFEPAAVMKVADRDRERQAILDVINLYGDETLHGALDDAGLLMGGREGAGATGGR